MEGRVFERPDVDGRGFELADEEGRGFELADVAGTDVSVVATRLNGFGTGVDFSRTI